MSNQAPTGIREQADLGREKGTGKELKEDIKGKSIAAENIKPTDSNF